MLFVKLYERNKNDEQKAGTLVLLPPTEHGSLRQQQYADFDIYPMALTLRDRKTPFFVGAHKGWMIHGIICIL
jgi:hypothetical protein